MFDHALRRPETTQVTDRATHLSAARRRNGGEVVRHLDDVLTHITRVADGGPALHAGGGTRIHRSAALGRASRTPVEVGRVVRASTAGDAGPVIRRLTDAPLQLLEQARTTDQAVIAKFATLGSTMTDLIEGLKAYLANQQTMSVSQKLAGIKQLQALRTAVETARVKAREHLAGGEGITLKTGVNADYDLLGAKFKDALNDTAKLFGAEQTEIARTREVERTGERMEQTLAAAERGELRHLLVSPDVIYSGDKGVEATPFPASVAPEKEHMIRLPPTVKAAEDPGTNTMVKLATKAASVKSPAQPLAILVVAGGHGDVGDMFEKGENTANGPMGYKVKEWLDLFITPLVKAGVRAHNIVLDACLSASMIPAFEPLLAPGGQIFGAMYSLESGNLVDDATWPKLLQVIETGGGDVRPVLEARMKEHHGARVAGHKVFHDMIGDDAGPVPPDVFAVYDFASKQLRYDRSLDKQFQGGYEPARDYKQTRSALETSAPHVIPTPTDRPT